MAELWMVDVNVLQHQLRFARHERPQQGCNNITDFWSPTTVKATQQGLEFDGWEVRWSSYAPDSLHSLEISRFTKRGDAVERTFYECLPVSGEFGTLYLRQKPKGFKAQYIAGDPHAAAWLEFGINEIQFVSPKRTYPSLFNSKLGECVTDWVHSSVPVFDAAGIELDNIPRAADGWRHFPQGECGNVAIHEAAHWAVVDAVYGLNSEWSCHYAVLYTLERNWESLRADLSWYLHTHGALYVPFNRHDSQSDWLGSEQSK